MKAWLVEVDGIGKFFYSDKSKTPREVRIHLYKMLYNEGHLKTMFDRPTIKLTWLRCTDTVKIKSGLLSTHMPCCLIELHEE